MEFRESKLYLMSVGINMTGYYIIHVIMLIKCWQSNQKSFSVNLLWRSWPLPCVSSYHFVTFLLKQFAFTSCCIFCLSCYIILAYVQFCRATGPKRQQKPYSCSCLFLKYKKAKRRKRQNKCLQKSFLTGVHSVEWPPAHVQGTIWWGVHSVDWPPAHV